MNNLLNDQKCWAPLVPFNLCTRIFKDNVTSCCLFPLRLKVPVRLSACLQVRWMFSLTIPADNFIILRTCFQLLLHIPCTTMLNKSWTLSTVCLSTPLQRTTGIDRGMKNKQCSSQLLVTENTEHIQLVTNAQCFSWAGTCLVVERLP